MASYVNKFANSLTNATGSLIGREHLAKLANSINKTFVSSKYRSLLNSGNVVQLISKNSHRSIQICSAPEDRNILQLYGDGQIGDEFFNAQFKLIINPKNGHITFQNNNNYIGFNSNNMLALLQEPTSTKKKDQLGSKIEFRLHEIIGSDEYFALESSYAAGKYLSVTPEGLVTVTKNKTTQDAYFSMHLVKEFIQPIMVPSNNQNVVTYITPAVPPTQSVNASARQSTISNRDSVAAASNNPFEEKEEEAAAAAASAQSTSGASAEHADSPPVYSSLFPRLPSNQ